MQKYTTIIWLIYFLLQTSENSGKRFQRNIKITKLDGANLICEDECEEATNCSPKLKVLTETPPGISKTNGRVVSVYRAGRLNILCYLEEFNNEQRMKRWITQTFISILSPGYADNSSVIDINVYDNNSDMGDLSDDSNVKPIDKAINEPEITILTNDDHPDQYVVNCIVTSLINENLEIQLFTIHADKSKNEIPLDPKSLSTVFSEDGLSISMNYTHEFYYSERYFNNSFECRSVDSFSKAYKSKFTISILPEMACQQNLQIEQKSNFQIESNANYKYEDTNGYLYCSCPGAHPQPEFYWRDVLGRIKVGKSLHFVDYLYQPYCCVAAQNLTSGEHEVSACLNDKDKAMISSVTWSDIKDKRVYSVNNLYALRYEYNGQVQLMSVYCETKPTDNETWIVIQRRFNGKENFARSWNDYKNGFGDLNGEFWIGNEKLYQLTNLGTMKIRFDVWDKDDNYAYAEYSSFSVAGETDNYRLSISGYSGEAGDSMSYHNNMQFSAKDSDNDKSSTSCSVNYGGKGGWWFYFCHHANLNGEYLSPGTNDGNGIEWNGFYGYRSLKRTVMKLSYTNR